jgi:lipid-A-disaccharide synthase-like uncharacterized protein
VGVGRPRLFWLFELLGIVVAVVAANRVQDRLGWWSYVVFLVVVWGAGLLPPLLHNACVRRTHSPLGAQVD